MVFPYVHATAMVLTLISAAVHPRDDVWKMESRGMEAETGRRIWIGLRKIDLIPLESTMIPVERCLLAGAPISLSHGELAATANSYRFIDAERIHRGCGPFHSWRES